MRDVHRPFRALIIAACVAVTAGCSGSSAPGNGGAGGSATPAASTPTNSAPASAQLSVRPVAPYGEVLTDARGFAVYVFEPDHARRVTCTGACAQAWPPVRPAGSPKTTAGTGVKPTLLGADTDPAGGSVVTYAGWPLYTYVGDHAPGYASGEALTIDGGAWYLIDAAGHPVTSGS